MLEKVARLDGELGAGERFDALREINHVRIHGGAHATAGKGRQLADTALVDHGSYAAHYEDVCARLVGELKSIERALR